MVFVLVEELAKRGDAGNDTAATAALCRWQKHLVPERSRDAALARIIFDLGEAGLAAKGVCQDVGGPRGDNAQMQRGVLPLQRCREDSVGVVALGARVLKVLSDGLAVGRGARFAALVPLHSVTNR